MSHMTNESDDGMDSKNHSDSPTADGGSGCGSGWGGTVLKKGPWTSAEDAILVEYVKKHGEGNWNAVQKHTGLSRCGKSCRLRWANHLRPNLKKGAFSQEEEQLIIELHAKMGNKWARMAAHLPGRTDNEIKNYWNTRIKRRQRAGLPLYPPEMHVQVLHGNQDHNKGGVIFEDKRHQDFLTGSYEPSIVFDSLKGNHGLLAYAPDLPDISSCNMLAEGASSSQCNNFVPLVTHCQKRFRESPALFTGYSNCIKDEFLPSDHLHDSASQKISRPFGSSFPGHPDPPTKNLAHSFDPVPGSHPLSNGNYSTSKPAFGPAKLELPSFQYPETNLLDSVDAFLQSPPPTGTLESGNVSPHNSGLLDMLLHEAKIRSSTKNGSQSSEKSLDSTTPGDIADGVNMGFSESEFKDQDDPLYSLDHSASSIFGECTITGATGSSDGSASLLQTFTGDNLKSEPVDRAWSPQREKDPTGALGVTRPDVLLASSWLDQSPDLVKETATVTDAIAALLGDDLGNEYMQMAAGTLGSCAWNNMPAVCQMAELP